MAGASPHSTGHLISTATISAIAGQSIVGCEMQLTKTKEEWKSFLEDTKSWVSPETSKALPIASGRPAQRQRAFLVTSTVGLPERRVFG